MTGGPRATLRACVMSQMTRPSVWHAPPASASTGPHARGSRPSSPMLASVELAVDCAEPPQSSATLAAKVRAIAIETEAREPAQRWFTVSIFMAQGAQVRQHLRRAEHRRRL